MAKDVTMRDIAKEMGVSTVTVSKALNNKEGVGNLLRASIRKKAEEMGYKHALEVIIDEMPTNYICL